MSHARSNSATALLVLGWWVAVAAVVVGVGWLITHPLAGPVDGFDDPVSRWFADQRSAQLNDVAEAGTLLGETVVGVGVALAAAVVFSVWQWSLRPAVFLAMIEAAIGGVYVLATHLDPRDRPPVRILDPGLVPDASFPSGHVATATAAYAGVVVLCRVYGRAAGRWAVPLLLLPVLVLLARLYQGAHHLTDVLTSVGYASVLLLVLARLVLPGPPARSDRRGGSPG